MCLTRLGSDTSHKQVNKQHDQHKRFSFLNFVQYTWNCHAFLFCLKLLHLLPTEENPNLHTYYHLNHLNLIKIYQLQRITFSTETRRSIVKIENA